MKTFEERKHEYMNKIMSNPGVLISMKKNTPLENIMIMLNPSDEKELTIASATISFVEDVIDIMYGEYELNFEPNIQENKALALNAELVNKLKNNEDINQDDYINDPALIANIIYDTLILLFLKDPDEIPKYIIEKCGLNLNNPLDEMLYNCYMEEAKEMTAKKTETTTKLFSEMNDDDVKLLVECYDEFHKLYEAGMKKSDDKTIGTK